MNRAASSGGSRTWIDTMPSSVGRSHHVAPALRLLALGPPSSRFTIRFEPADLLELRSGRILRHRQEVALVAAAVATRVIARTFE